MQIYCKNCKKYGECTLPKILVLVSNKKQKQNQNALNVWLIELYKINDKYDLEHLVKHFFLY